jgi:hypothetical protein
MTAYYTLHTTDGRQVVIPVPPGEDRWLLAVKYMNAYFSRHDVAHGIDPRKESALCL